MPVLAADEMQTVEVTVQSRRQAVQDVPITMQVVTSKDIEALGAKDLSNFNGYIPGLSVDSGEPTQPSFGIRGVQPGDFGIATDSPVGIYVDGVYAGKTGGALMNFVDVQRIEVIKGPQGTLFGRNSAAGAISISTNEPSQYAESAGHLKVGNFGRVDADAMVNIPLSAAAAARFVVVSAHSKGWLTNEATGNKAGGDNDWATRLSFKNTFGQTKINLGWEHEKMAQDGRPAIAVVTNPALPLGGYTGVYNAAYIKNFVDPFNTPLKNDMPGKESRTFDGVTLRIETPLAGMTFNSTTAWRAFDTVNLTDNDGSTRPDLSLTTLDAKKAHSWQQEFKLSAKNDTLDWIGGVSFYNNIEHQDAGAYVTTATLDTLSMFGGGAPNFAMLFGGLAQAGIPGVNPKAIYPWQETHYSDVQTKSSSIYGDVIWHVTPSTNLTTGLRWSQDSKTMTWYVPGRVSTDLDTFLKTYGPYVGLTPASFPSNIIFDAAALLASTPVTRTKDWTNMSPRLVLDHKANKDTMLFASLSRGYQAGGFNIFTPPNPNAANASDRDPSFSPETMTNFEAGMKLLFPAQKASLNASFFAYKFDNLQDINLYRVGAIPTYNVITSDQKANGLDVDGRIRVTPAVTLFGGFEYIDQNYTKYQRHDSSGKVILDLSDQPVGTPKFTGMGGILLNWMAQGGHMSYSFQGTYSSKKRCNADTGDLGCLDTPTIKTGEATSKFDTRLAWENTDRSMGVALIVNNVFDQRYVTSLGGQTKQFGMPYVSLTTPRAFGVEFKASM
jgi:iron complex outermembrane receptor protein